MINDAVSASLGASAGNIVSLDTFSEWVRAHLRHAMPHAAFLGTVGRLYGVGSVATHRLSVDFPLGMVEALKNGSGALDDPLISSWFRSGKPRYLEVDQSGDGEAKRHWQTTLRRFGFRNAMIDGVLDHNAKRFAVFQFYNCCDSSALANIRLFSSIVKTVAVAAWAAVDRQLETPSRSLLGHPTLSLTPTEIHIIQLLARGLSNKEIARLRGVSDSTVKTQVQRTGAKLGATRRAEIVAIAMPILCPLPAQTFIDYGDL